MSMLRKGVVLGLFAFSLPTPVWAEEDAPAERKVPDVSVGAEAVSAYVYHGITYNDGIALQPWLDVAMMGFGVNVWASFDFMDYDDALDAYEFSEVDLTARYGGTLENWFNYSISLAEYTYPNVPVERSPIPGSREIIGELSREIVKGLTAGVKVQYDVDEVKDVYATAKIGYSYTFMESLTASIKGTAAYAGDDVYPCRSAGFHNYTATGGVDYQISEKLGVGAYLTYMDSLDHSVLAEEDMDVNLFGAITGFYAF